MKKIKPKMKKYGIISDAIERGIQWGWQHAHKHTDTPDEDSVKQHIYDDVMNEIFEVVNFD
jgi:hypothetical protein